MPNLGGGYRQRGAGRDRVADLLMRETGPLTTPEVAERCRISRALASASLAELERAGFVERRPGPGREPDRWLWRNAAVA